LGILWEVIFDAPKEKRAHNDQKTNKYDQKLAREMRFSFMFKFNNFFIASKRGVYVLSSTTSSTRFL
jgi:hypothetical protein